jgi:hypothetical protein
MPDGYFVASSVDVVAADIGPIAHAYDVRVVAQDGFTDIQREVAAVILSIDMPVGSTVSFPVYCRKTDLSVSWRIRGLRS